jgi:anthranilate synthase component I
LTTLKPSLEEFKELSKTGNLIPLWTELAADYETPVSAFHKLNANNQRPCFLLESAERSDEIGRFSFLGTDPRLEIRSSGRKISVRKAGESKFSSYQLPKKSGDPLFELEELMKDYRPVKIDGLPVFSGGAVGFLTYDMVRFFENTVPKAPPDQIGLPEMAFMITETVVIFDHRFRKIQVVANICTDDYDDLDVAYAAARSKVNAIVERLSQPMGFPSFSLMAEQREIQIASNTTRQEYLNMVKSAKEYILAGDIFQVVPSQRFEADFQGRPIDLYRALRHVNPSPYMFCLQWGDEFALVGSSPEVHVQAINGRIKIRPIAGTRWRGKTVEEDQALARELLNDPKERAEHLMLVDLARNDVGRVSEYGSVDVSERYVVEKYSHVMHIVSNVYGKLRPDQTAYDVMRATFPAGTVSGSPKVRAMQIINELEKSKRGAYSGAIGYFGFDGNHDSCIALRTVVLKNGKAYVQAGAGVVADSIPENEYEETINKARGMLRAVERAKHLG